MEGSISEDQIMSFPSAVSWEQWLSDNHRLSRGVWIKFAKKASGIESVTYNEALDEALCYGWIDGQRKSCDEQYYLQRFTPRRPKGLWSKRNVAKIAELSAAGRMQPAGLKEVESAQLDGRWQAAYDSQKDMVIPEDFLLALEKNEKAKSFFGTLNKASLYAIGWRLHTAKTPETRARRFAVLLEKLSNGEGL
jgi:uncharacterized protein YdeI (YjbR/CyaY-like superfamily)